MCDLDHLSFPYTYDINGIEGQIERLNSDFHIKSGTSDLVFARVDRGL